MVDHRSDDGYEESSQDDGDGGRRFQPGVGFTPRRRRGPGGTPSYTAASADAARFASLLFEMTPPSTTAGLHSRMSPQCTFFPRLHGLAELTSIAFSRYFAVRISENYCFAVGENNLCVCSL